MSVVTYSGPIRTGKEKNDTISYIEESKYFSFDPTSASQVSLGKLPKDGIPYEVITFGGATGGVSPTVDIGTVGDDDGFANEQAADAVSSSLVDVTGGALLGTQLTVDTEVFGKVGASAATGGAVIGVIKFVRPTARIA